MNEDTLPDLAEHVLAAAAEISRVTFPPQLYCARSDYDRPQRTRTAPNGTANQEWIIAPFRAGTRPAPVSLQFTRNRSSQTIN